MRHTIEGGLDFTGWPCLWGTIVQCIGTLVDKQVTGLASPCMLIVRPEVSNVHTNSYMYSPPGYMGTSLTQLSRIMTQETTHHHTVNIYS